MVYFALLFTILKIVESSLSFIIILLISCLSMPFTYIVNILILFVVIQYDNIWLFINVFIVSYAYDILVP